MPPVPAREAAANGATYAQTPEMTGALVRDKEARRAQFTSEDRDLIAIAASRLAGELGIYIHVGSTAILRADGKLANRALLFGPDGERIAVYDKIHMFDVDLDNGESWRESAAYEAGTTAVVAELPFAKFIRCHCSRCRGATGSAYGVNAYVLPPAFRWTCGADTVERFDLPEARSFSTAFCRRCGSPLPHFTRSGREVIIPAGSLWDDPGTSPTVEACWLGDRFEGCEKVKSGPASTWNATLFSSARAVPMPAPTVPTTGTSRTISQALSA